MGVREERGESERGREREGEREEKSMTFLYHSEAKQRSTSFPLLLPQGEFTDEGSETHFTIGSYSTFIRAVSSGNKMKGLLYTLNIDGTELEPLLT